MMNDTADADDVADWLQKKYPSEFGGDKLVTIHTKKSGEVSESDLDTARKLSRDVDDEKSPVNCIVSVLMLREGWDVQGVTVIVGLRPYTAKANILPEQTVGRGLRLMFRGARQRLRRARGCDRQQEVHRVCRGLGARRRHGVRHVQSWRRQGGHRQHRARSEEVGQRHFVAGAASDLDAQEVVG